MRYFVIQSFCLKGDDLVWLAVSIVSVFSVPTCFVNSLLPTLALHIAGHAQRSPRWLMMTIIHIVAYFGVVGLTLFHFDSLVQGVHIPEYTTMCFHCIRRSQQGLNKGHLSDPIEEKKEIREKERPLNRTFIRKGSL